MAGAITGEFLGGGKGFGELIRVAASQLDTGRVFALIIYLSFLGLAMFGTVCVGAAAADLLAQGHHRRGRSGVKGWWVWAARWPRAEER